MKKEEVLEKARMKKDSIGEMERVKTNKANWIAVIAAGVLSVGFMIVLGALGQRSSIFAIAAICFTWASVFYFCQYFIAKRPKAVLIGAVLEGLGACIMIANFILSTVGVI